MARISLKMMALGAEKEKCTGCERQFSRGEMMSAVENDDGSPAGWYCDECIKNWNSKQGEAQ